MSLTDASYIQLESDRLASKLQNINNEVTAQTRSAQLTDSYRKRYSNYLMILLVLIFAFLASLGINKAQEKFPDAPGVLFDGLYLLVLLIVVYTLYYTISDLAIRSQMNYDEVDLPPPKANISVNMQMEKDNKAQAAGDITAQTKMGTAGCVGTVCCGPNTIWDANTNFCAPVSSFTTLADANKLLTLKPSQQFADVKSVEDSTALSYQMTKFYL
jgi:hypothetical protein